MEKKLWLVMHTHRHGHDHYLIELEERPSLDAVIERFVIDYEDDREDENLEIIPIEVQSMEK